MSKVTNKQHDIVIGRMQVDNYLMGIIRDHQGRPSLNSSSLIPSIDLSQSELIDATVVGRSNKIIVYLNDQWIISCLAIGIHEGKDGFYKRNAIRRKRKNNNWNYGVMKQYNIHYGYLSERGNRVLHLHKGMCCKLSTYK